MQEDLTLFKIEAKETKIYECFILAKDYQEARKQYIQIDFDLFVEQPNSHDIFFHDLNEHKGDLTTGNYQTLYNAYGTLTISASADKEEFPYLTDLYDDYKIDFKSNHKNHNCAVDYFIDKLTEKITTENKVDVMKEIKKIFNYESILFLS